MNQSRAAGGDLMIKNIDIRNFKCFDHLMVENCRRVNVIVGDNGAGKTALLEAMFIALGSSSQLVLRFRQFRGLDGAFRGPVRKIEEAIWRDYFHNMDMSKSISITLTGDGPEARSVVMERGAGGETLVPLEADMPVTATSGIQFEWKDNLGISRRVAPQISGDGFKFPETGEDLSDFFFLASNQTFSSSDNADRFSDLDEGRKREFVRVFTEQYPWVKSLTVRSSVGSPAIYAQIDGVEEYMPVTSVSGGINRLITALLMIASRKRSVVLIDELENGIFHTHHKAFWCALLSFARKYEGQLFITTHSEEFLEALAEAIDIKEDDVSLWRTRRVDGRPEVRQFFGKQVPIGIKAGEVR